MASNLTITYTIKFEKVITDLRECSACNDVIYSEMNNLVIYFNKIKPRETNICLCNSCKDVYDKN